MQDKIANFFQFKYNNTDFKKETIAGVTSFMGMAYILAVIPNLLENTGMDVHSAFMATALSAFIGTMLMALWANYPFILAPGLGLSIYFTYYIVGNLGMSWETGLAAVFIEGILFVLLTLTKIRTTLFEMIPPCLRGAAAVGVGLYVARIGFIQTGFIVSNRYTVMGIYYWQDQASLSQAIPVVLSLIGLVITGIFYAKRKRYGILVSIFITWFLGILCQLVGLYVPDPELGLESLIPQFTRETIWHSYSLAPTFLHMDFSHILSLDFLRIVGVLLFMDLFDTLGTLIGCSYRAGYIQARQTLPDLKQTFFTDAIATVIGAVFGAPTTTIHIESTLGILEGGRTGFTAIVAAILFLMAIPFAPLFIAIPTFATAPALIIVGFYMLQQISSINFHSTREGIPAFLCIMGMPLTSSITSGLGMGIISYTIINLVTGNKRDVKKPMYIVSLLFLFKYFFLG